MKSRERRKEKKKRTHKSSNVMSLNETLGNLCSLRCSPDKPKSKRMSNELHKLPGRAWPTTVCPILISFGPFRATNKLRKKQHNFASVLCEEEI